jgi:hypothetical protein
MVKGGLTWRHSLASNGFLWQRFVCILTLD